jgi:hypothetical protein
MLVTEAQAGGNIIAVGTFLGEDPSRSHCPIMGDGVSREKHLVVLTPVMRSVDDVREV